MKEENLGKLLGELEGDTTEEVRPSLAEDIKHQIPHNLTARRGGMNTINIMIHLRINKLTAAAVIIITMILSISLLGEGSFSEGIYQDGKLLLKHYLAGEGDELASMPKLYDHLISQGNDVTYYGDIVDSKDNNAVLMQWKIDDGKYTVILSNFGTVSVKDVSAEQLIELQRRMLLQERTK